MLGVVLVISPALYIFFLSLFFIIFFPPREATIARCKRGERGERGGEEEKKRKEKRMGEGEGRKKGRKEARGREGRSSPPPPSLRLIYAARKTFTA